MDTLKILKIKMCQNQNKTNLNSDYHLVLDIFVQFQIKHLEKINLLKILNIKKSFNTEIKKKV